MLHYLGLLYLLCMLKALSSIHSVNKTGKQFPCARDPRSSYWSSYGRRLDDLDAPRFRRRDRFLHAHRAFGLDAKALHNVVASSHLHMAWRVGLSPQEFADDPLAWRVHLARKEIGFRYCGLLLCYLLTALDRGQQRCICPGSLRHDKVTARFFWHLLSFKAAVLFLAFISIRFDFGDSISILRGPNPICGRDVISPVC